MKESRLVSLFYNQTKTRPLGDWRSYINLVDSHHNLSVSSLTRIFWSLTKLGCSDLMVILPLVSRISSKLDECITTQDLSNLAQSLRTLDLYPADIAHVMISSCNKLRFKSFSAIDQWNILYFMSACQEMNANDRSSFFLAVIPDLHLSEMSAKGLASLAQAYAKTIHRWPPAKERLLRDIHFHFITRRDRTALGSALIAKALAPIIPISDTLWEEYTNVDLEISSFEWLLFTDAFATSGSLFEENLQKKMAKIGTGFKFSPAEISRAAGLFSRCN